MEINHLLWRQREIKWASFSVLFLSGIRKVLLKNSPNTYMSRRINQWGEIFCYHLDPEKELEKLEPGYLSSGYLATSDAFRCHVSMICVYAWAMYYLWCKLHTYAGACMCDTRTHVWCIRTVYASCMLWLIRFQSYFPLSEDRNFLGFASSLQLCKTKTLDDR